MAKFKKILIFPDFCSSGIWDGNDPYHTMIDPEELGIPENLAEQFHAWINLYDRGYKKDYSGLTAKAVKPVYTEGLRLAKEIKKLYPKTEIEYWSEGLNCKLRKKKIP
jgi:hypothetical protein